MLLCNYCTKECKNDNSLRNHQRFCKLNPDRQDPSLWATGNRKGKPSWNKGLTDDARCKHSEQTRELMKQIAGNRTPEHFEKISKAVSETVNKRVADGSWHTSLARRMHINYNGIDLHGSWELAYAKYLDSIGVKWVRNKDSFTYLFEGKERKYTPDFYLISTDEYIEIKGYKTAKDEAKWSQFPVHRKLVVLMKNELIALGIEL